MKKRKMLNSNSETLKKPVTLRKSKGKKKPVMPGKSEALLDAAALTCMVLGLLILSMGIGNGDFFGSNGDWDSQHVGAAELLRQTMLTQGTLFPQFVTAGGGSNVYDFAYYGFLRPDVLLSCLAPQIEMKYFIAGYSILGVVASVIFCDLWLKRQGISRWAALSGSILLAASTCFFHAHRQIIFVNYMPFLFLALLGVDRLLERRRSLLLIVSLTMIYLHSFYYAPACLAVCGIYGVYKLQMGAEQNLSERRWKPILRAAAAVALSLALAAVFLLPTGLDILSTSKDAGRFDDETVKLIDLSFSGLLYQPYGCGMTMAALYFLIAAIGRAVGSVTRGQAGMCSGRGGEEAKTMLRKQRGLGALAAVLLVCLAVPAVWLALNGFLYARAKILIPFVPLIVLVSAEMIGWFWERPKEMPLSPALLCLLLAVFSIKNSWDKVMESNSLVLTAMAIDALILTAVVMLVRKPRQKKLEQGTLETRQVQDGRLKRNRWICGLLVVPVVVSLAVNCGENWFSAEDQRQNPFTAAELEDAGVFSAESGYGILYRTDVIADSLTNANTLPDGRLQQTSMYSSVTNDVYSTFYYDTMGNPISIQNRVALLPDENPLFNYFMGVKYLICKESGVPAGYTPVLEKQGYVLAENDAVLPVCYGTSQVMTEKDFERLDFSARLAALCSRAIVPADGAGAGEEEQFSNPWRRVCDLEMVVPAEGVEEELTKALLKAVQETGEDDVESAARRKILLVRFGVDSPMDREVTISIGNMKNKLASGSAPYPNRNYQFTYVLEWESNQVPEVKASAERYTIDNLQVYVMDLPDAADGTEVDGAAGAATAPDTGGAADMTVAADAMAAAEIAQWEPDGKTMFQGQIDLKEDGWFVTSFPYREGYQVLVDGEEAAAQKVNTAFVGVPVTAGRHRITITYVAPGFKAGLAITLAAAALVTVIALGEWILQRKKQEKEEDLQK